MEQGTHAVACGAQRTTCSSCFSPSWGAVVKLGKHRYLLSHLVCSHHRFLPGLISTTLSIRNSLERIQDADRNIGSRGSVGVGQVRPSSRLVDIGFLARPSSLGFGLVLFSFDYLLSLGSVHSPCLGLTCSILSDAFLAQVAPLGRCQDAYVVVGPCLPRGYHAQLF